MNARGAKKNAKDAKKSDVNAKRMSAEKKRTVVLDVKKNAENVKMNGVVRKKRTLAVLVPADRGIVLAERRVQAVIAPRLTLAMPWMIMSDANVSGKTECARHKKRQVI